MVRGCPRSIIHFQEPQVTFLLMYSAAGNEFEHLPHVYCHLAHLWWSWIASSHSWPLVSIRLSVVGFLVCSGCDYQVGWVDMIRLLKNPVLPENKWCCFVVYGESQALPPKWLEYYGAFTPVFWNLDSFITPDTWVVGFSASRGRILELEGSPDGDRANAWQSERRWSPFYLGISWFV